MRPRFLPSVTAVLVAANVIAYGLELAGGGQTVCEAHGLVPAIFVRTGDFGPVLTSLFLHDPTSLLHLGGNMVFLAVFGAIVEHELGALSFGALYLAAGIAGALMHVLVDPSATVPLVGASGAIFGVLAVGGALRPRLLGFVVSFTALNVWYAFAGTGGGVSFGAHIGGFIIGFLVAAALGRPRHLKGQAHDHL
jgi:membrane associated rhomboid family serine protease